MQEIKILLHGYDWLLLLSEQWKGTLFFFFYFGGPGGAVQCPKNKLLRSQKQHHYRIEGKPVCQNGRGVQSCPPTEEAVKNAAKSIGYESKTTLFTWEVKENPW